jgi:hypothetical protein
MPPNLFIAGVPATGKTWLGNWLAETQGYVHIDAEKKQGADLDRVNLHGEWNELLETGNGNNFMAAAQRLKRPLVLNWGLRMKFLGVVTALQELGVEVWWLHADRDQARTALIEREKQKPEDERIPVECFDRQMDDIEQHWPEIERAFGKNTVRGLNRDGSQRTPDELWTEIGRIRNN